MLRAFNPAGGGGGGGVSGTGTPGKVAKWTLANTIGDSLISDDGTQIYTTANFGVGAAVGTGKAIDSLTLTNGGTGYTNGTYGQVALTTLTGTGTGATADIVVAGGIVTTVVLRSPGQGYAVNDTISCASIGAGANFVLTVATVTNYAGVTGDLYATRIGAGTTRPVMGADILGSARVSSFSAYSIPNPGFGSYTATRAGLYVDSSSEAGGVTKPVDGENNVSGVYSNPAFDTSLRTASVSVIGGYFRASLSAAGAGTTSVLGVSSAVSVTSGVTGKTIAGTGVLPNLSSSTGGAGNTFSTWVLYGGSYALTTTNATPVTTAGYFVPGAASFSGAAHVVTTFYGIRLQAASLSGGATITNRWGISQEDTLANNLFAGVVIHGSGEASASPVGQTLRGPSGSGSNIAGGSITIAGGNSTGSGAGGSIIFQTAAAGGAGSGANTLTTRASIDSAGNLAFNSGFGSAATAYGCRAWVNFNGTGTVAIRSSGNVTSITDNGVGDYTVNMTNAMSDANYAIACSVGGTNGVDIIRPRDESTARTTTAFRLLVMTNAFAPGDSAVVNAMVVR